MNREEKIEKIFLTALKVFAEYGFKKTTIEDIANELNLAKSTLYLYASDKRDLYKKSVALAFSIWQEKVKEAVAQCNGPVAKLEVLTHRAYEYLSEDKAFQKILERDPDLFPLFSSKDPYAEINRESIEMLCSVLREGVSAGVFEVDDIEAVAQSLFSIYIMFIQKTYIADEGSAVNILFEQTIKLLMRGLLTRK
jgi:AcrR family transcriptional regulator